MTIDLVNYLKDRYAERDMQISHPGPVVTIARETGCPGKLVAQSLADQLNQRLKLLGKKNEWKWVGKEVFIEAAKELGLEPDMVQNVFKKNRNVVDEILSSQSSKFYKSDVRVRKTIGQVIRSMANDGNVIILGRGSVAITRDIERSLHVFLEAPLEWRIAVFSEKHCCSPELAKKYVLNTDKQRIKYRDFYQGKNTDYTTFDVKFNCMTLKVEEIAEAIIKLMEARKLI